MATHLNVHAWNPKSHDLKAIEGQQVKTILIFAMTAVSETSNYAATNHYNASWQGRVIQVVVSTLHTPMGMSPLTGGTRLVLLGTCQMIMTREGMTRCPWQLSSSLAWQVLGNILSKLVTILDNGYVCTISVCYDFCSFRHKHVWDKFTTMTDHSGRRRPGKSWLITTSKQ